MGGHEQAILLMGLIPNRKGQPLLVEWRAALWNGTAWTLESLETFLARTGLKAGTLANRANTTDTAALQARLPAAVAAMRAHMIRCQQSFSQSMTVRLAGTLGELERLQTRQLQQLEQRLAANQQAEQFKRTRREQRTRQIQRVFDDYRQWVQDTMTTEPEPFLQVLAAVVP
jgi:hypothetical protein